MREEAPGSFIRHDRLAELGIPHGFGLKGAESPRGLLRARQVHGRAVAETLPDGGLSLVDADAIVSAQPGVPIGVLTADCVPILAAASGGLAVTAIHAGWRGLAAGVIEAGMAALQARAAAGAALVAVVGPCIGACCYEVDEPVLGALRTRFGSDLEAAVAQSRPGHAWLDLALLARRALVRAGVAEEHVDWTSGTCTACDAARFHSYRRDGERAGRLVHHIAALGAPP